jgi:hypothetical protein
VNRFAQRAVREYESDLEKVACFGVDQHEAFLKAMLSAGFKVILRHQRLVHE